MLKVRLHRLAKQVVMAIGLCPVNDWEKGSSLTLKKKKINNDKTLHKHLLICCLLQNSYRKLVTVNFTEEIEKSTVIYICLWFHIAPQK